MGSMVLAAKPPPTCLISPNPQYDKKPCPSTREKQAFLIPIIPTRQVEMQSKLFYRPFDSIWLYLIPIIPILWGIRLSAIKKLSGDAINVSGSQFFVYAHCKSEILLLISFHNRCLISTAVFIETIPNEVIGRYVEANREL